MLLDKRLEMSFEQAITTATENDSTNVIDLWGSANITPGEPVAVIIRCVADVAGTVANTTFKVYSDDNADPTTVVAERVGVLKAITVAGYELQLLVDSAGQYMKVTYEPNATATAGKYSAHVGRVNDTQTNQQGFSEDSGITADT
jgi:hypothetical protein